MKADGIKGEYSDNKYPPGFTGPARDEKDVDPMGIHGTKVDSPGPHPTSFALGQATGTISG